MRRLDLEGQKYGRLTLIYSTGINKSKQRMWLAQCDCGKETIVCQQHVRDGRTTSCGCFHKENQTKHGMAHTKEWHAYHHAKARCKPNHKHHQHYFDRGIRCHFTSFEEFFAEIGPAPSLKHSVDRIDNDKGYEPGNIRWATKSEQERNRRCDNCAALKARIAELEAQLA
jgi:hypothetical protein